MNHETLPAQGPVDVNVSPQACPTCGESEHMRTSKWWDSYPNGEHWNTWCCFCGHEAKRADDKRSAVENWNNEAQDAALQQLADEGQQMGLWANASYTAPVPHNHVQD